MWNTFSKVKRMMKWTTLPICWGPASAESRDTLRMDDIGKWMNEWMNEWHGVTKLRWVRPVTLFSKGTFIPWLVHRGKWKMQGHAESAQTLQQFCPYRNQDFFCIPFPQMMLCTLSSGLGGLWTFYDPLLIKATQQETYFPSKCFFFIFLIYVTLRKC